MSLHKLPPFWVNPLHSDGTPINNQLIEAARQMWPEAVYSTKRCLGDASRAAEIMETAVHKVWTKSLQGSIEDFGRVGGYLRKTFYHSLSRIALRESWFIYTDLKILGIDRENPHSLPPNRKKATVPSSKSQRPTKARGWLWTRRGSYGNSRLIETSVQLDLLLARLGVRERTLLILSWIHEDDWENISQQTGIPIGTAKVIASRALRKLQQIAKATSNHRNNARSQGNATE